MSDDARSALAATAEHSSEEEGEEPGEPGPERREEEPERREEEPAGREEEPERREEEPAGREEDEDGHRPADLRAAVRERRISLSTMDRQLRLATGVAVAVLAGSVLLMSLRSLGGGAVFLGGQALESAPVFAGSLVLLAVGAGYVLTGAVLGGLALGVPVLVAMVGAAAFEVGVFGHLAVGHGVATLLPDWSRWSERAVVATLAALDASMLLATRRREPGKAVRLLLLAANCALVGTFLLLLWATAPTLQGLSLQGEVVSVLMLDLALLCSPVLAVAAVDFGEWGEILALRAASLAKAPLRRAAVASLLALGLVAFGCYRFAEHRGPAGFQDS